jgi:hypothetical protein
MPLIPSFRGRRESVMKKQKKTFVDNWMKLCVKIKERLAIDRRMRRASYGSRRN